MSATDLHGEPSSSAAQGHPQAGGGVGEPGRDPLDVEGRPASGGSDPATEAGAAAGVHPGAARADAERRCRRCGAPLRPDQDWCLVCGTAVTTTVARARGWRAPLAVAAAVLGLAVAALVVAFVELSRDTDRPATPTPTAAPAATPSPSPTPFGSATPAPGSTPVAPTVTPSVTPSVTPTVTPTVTPSITPSTGAGIASWPAGRSAWTVVLFSGRTRAEAESRARALQGAATTVGVLRSDDFGTLRKGYFVVFSGQYDTQSAAQRAADGLRTSAPGAYARYVAPQG